MARMSTQWLTGYKKRRRGHGTINVQISALVIRDDSEIWLKATKSGGDYQEIHLVSKEADALGSHVVACMSQKAKNELLQQLLGELTQTKLIRALALHLGQRVKRSDQSIAHEPK